jgi:hypothetical protein
VSTPTGSCCGAITVRARVSASTSRAPPASTLAGSSTRWSLPMRQAHQVRHDQADEADRPVVVTATRSAATPADTRRRAACATGTPSVLP